MFNFLDEQSNFNEQLQKEFSVETVDDIEDKPKQLETKLSHKNEEILIKKPQDDLAENNNLDNNNDIFQVNSEQESSCLFDRLLAIQQELLKNDKTAPNFTQTYSDFFTDEDEKSDNETLPILPQNDIKTNNKTTQSDKEEEIERNKLLDTFLQQFDAVKITKTQNKKSEKTEKVTKPPKSLKERIADKLPSKDSKNLQHEKQGKTYSVDLTPFSVSLKDQLDYMELERFKEKLNIYNDYKDDKTQRSDNNLADNTFNIFNFEKSPKLTWRDVEKCFCFDNDNTLPVSKIEFESMRGNYQEYFEMKQRWKQMEMCVNKMWASPLIIFEKFNQLAV
ncbi:hypothetical protein EIN_169510 [Entamoeba invadens IP1]|uniref:Uncharacterized protein n=1 Tax=Entamoeba invadens IP1 TaxID=370355 RepID=A0A0A1TVR0_ENTIV|nr:hypothetical protein EIN_169510 [Entamoeba invadens IP1]ELP84506.1 hypothetical protein EIN_169510 [Entamoeba invadens IP1]|eukprot:XP_004183852.1 hypothetical protein EIN_169510 [Entamoeba invadens IP1]